MIVAASPVISAPFWKTAMLLAAAAARMTLMLVLCAAPCHFPLMGVAVI